MYIKVTHGDNMGGDFLIEATDPLYSGLAAIPFDPNQDDDIVEALSHELGRQLSSSESPVPLPFNHAYVLEIDPAQTEYEKNKGVLAVRYVWWFELNDGIHVVITTRNIFIVGDNGKTIDRVR